MRLSDFKRYLLKLATKINTVSKKPFQEETARVLAELQKHSPVDSGKYKESWKVKRQFLKIVFYNDDPKFGLLEYGAEPNTAPWYFPKGKQSSKSKKTSKPTGKLKLVKGKVWAGGLNPGHELTVGGAITPVLEKYKSARFDESMANDIVKRL